MKPGISTLLLFLRLATTPGCVLSSPIQVSATSFAAHGGSTITDAGTTTISGDVGLSPGSSISGFATITLLPPSTIRQSDPVAIQAPPDDTTV